MPALPVGLESTDRGWPGMLSLFPYRRPENEGGSAEAAPGTDAVLHCNEMASLGPSGAQSKAAHGTEKSMVIALCRLKSLQRD